MRERYCAHRALEDARKPARSAFIGSPRVCRAVGYVGTPHPLVCLECRPRWPVGKLLVCSVPSLSVWSLWWGFAQMTHAIPFTSVEVALEASVHGHVTTGYVYASYVKARGRYVRDWS